MDMPTAVTCAATLVPFRQFLKPSIPQLRVSMKWPSGRHNAKIVLFLVLLMCSIGSSLNGMSSKSVLGVSREGKSTTLSKPPKWKRSPAEPSSVFGKPFIIDRRSPSFWRTPLEWTPLLSITANELLYECDKWADFALNLINESNSNRSVIVLTEEEAMEMENNHKKQIIAIRNELQFRLDESEALLESVVKENKTKDKKIAEQMALLQELREIRDNSVAFAEYETLKDKYDKTYLQLSQMKDANQSLNKQLESDAKELETLFKSVDTKTQELHTLKTKMSDLALKCREKDNELQALNASKESMRDMARDLEKERLENVKLNELLNIFREEKLKQSDLNISVDDFNQSINQSLNRFVTSFNGSSVGESMDCVVNIKLQELETTLEDKCRQLKDKTSENEEMAKQMSQMEAFLVEKCSQYESIRKEVNETTEKFDLLKANCSELEAQVDHLSAEYLDLQLESESQRKTNDELILTLKTENESLENELKEEREATEKANKKFGEEMSLMREQLEEKIEDVIDMKKTIDNKCEENKLLNDSKDVLIQQLSDREDSIENIKHEMNSVIKEKTLLETQLKEEKMNGIQAIQEIESRLEEKCCQYESIQKEVNEKNQELDLIKVNCNQMEANVERLSSEYLSLQLESESQSKANKELIQTLQTENESLEKELKEEREELKMANKKFEKEVDFIREQLDVKVEEAIDLKEKIGELEEQNQSMVESKVVLIQELNDMKVMVENTAEEKRVISETNAVLTQNLEESKQQIQKTNEENQLLSETKDVLTQELNDMKTRIYENMKREMESIIEEKTRLETQLNEEKVSVITANQEIKNQLFQLKTKLEEKCCQYESIQKEVKNKDQELDLLRTDCNQFKAEVNQLSDEYFSLQLESESQKKENDETIKTLKTGIESLENELKEEKELSEKTNKKFAEEMDLMREQLDISDENKSLVESKEVLAKELNDLKVLVENTSEEKRVMSEAIKLQEMHAIVDKRFTSLKREKSSLAQMLSEEQNKRLQLESQLTENKRNERTIEEYEKSIKDLNTRLNTEEMSFMFERKTKERLSKENEQYSRKIQFLENEVKKLNELLTANRTPPVAHPGPVFSMPTTVNIHTNQPNNQTNLSISPMDISHSNPNSSSFSLNISRKLPTGTGSRLTMADEDGEFMDPNNLIALKRGECSLSDSHLDEERLSILQRRNTLVLPHLKTSYGVELPFMPNKVVDSESIKNGFPSNESMKALQRGFVSNDSLNPLKQIQNISYQRSEFTSRRNNSSISCDNVSINTINDKTFNKRVENIRYNSSKVSVKNLTPTKMFKRMMKGNAKTWTPNKNSAYDSNRSVVVLPEEEAMEMENNHKKQIIAIRNELQLRSRKSEALLESAVKENKMKDKKIAEQMALLQELREIRDNSVAFAEYETLKDKYDKTCHQLSQMKDANQSLNKQLESDAKELKTLYKSVDTKTQELHTLKTKMSDLALKCREKDHELQALNASKESMRDMARDLEKERLENVKLNEMLNIFREEKLKQRDLNISVDDFNQSIKESLNRSVTSFNGSSVGKTMDCVVNIKLQELEITLEDKCRQLNDKTDGETNGANVAFLVEKCSQYESIRKEVSETTEKFDLLKANCSELEAQVDHLSAEYLDLQLESESQRRTNDELILTLKSENESLENELKEEREAFKENKQYSRKIHILENEVNELLTANRTPVASTATFFSMPTSVITHTNQPIN
ncbi:unnamed protein product [Medioppia subpectinata]|uniref:Uncharacterized protein n=1 Tax=Medioppia subpectinata TaxID=1979941 RepID=A0A7R9PYR3_9ACAR|nr:unnamed protein product [Medioppia subpectinata]CAG2106194.1 unnamed protein product [Medioppia subpectinata]